MFSSRALVYLFGFAAMSPFMMVMFDRLQQNNLTIDLSPSGDLRVVMLFAAGFLAMAWKAIADWMDQNSGGSDVGGRR